MWNEYEFEVDRPSLVPPRMSFRRKHSILQASCVQDLSKSGCPVKLRQQQIEDGLVMSVLAKYFMFAYYGRFVGNQVEISCGIAPRVQKLQNSGSVPQQQPASLNHDSIQRVGIVESRKMI